MTTQSSPQSPLRDRLSITAVVVQICILVILLVVFNAYPEEVGVYRTATDTASFTPLLAPGFYAALPWLDAWWGISLGLALVLLSFHRWTVALRCADIVVDFWGSIVLWRLLVGAPLVVAHPGSGWPLDGWPFLDLNIWVRLALGVALVGLLVGVARKLRSLAGRLDALAAGPDALPRSAGPESPGR